MPGLFFCGIHEFSDKNYMLSSAWTQKGRHSNRYTVEKNLNSTSRTYIFLFFFSAIKNSTRKVGGMAPPRRISVSVKKRKQSFFYGKTQQIKLGLRLFWGLDLSSSKTQNYIIKSGQKGKESIGCFSRFRQASFSMTAREWDTRLIGSQSNVIS